ncbi:DNA-cytosine methyltransferase (EC 2.1.1.37) [uncultured Gammaproteobacteria bacterium]|jgi:DNA (cytosine-5)-methyltransferase 1|nr:DNA-cytosine methyltransferase (EC 2.1.1.37) [uncultured Gammaproteobacteria bacterium]
MFKFIDLFAGIGGFHKALSNLGGECVLACEIDKDCQTVYNSAFPSTHLISNIRTITRNDIRDDDSIKSTKEIKSLVPDHDMLCAGFPCQPFSKSGKQQGVLDKTRGTLFFDIMQIIKAKHPKYVLLENVRNLTGVKHRETWALIIQSLREEGYTVSEKPTILSPHLMPEEFGGSPQTRDRVFISATLNGEKEFFVDRNNFKSIHNPDLWDISKYLQDDSDIKNVKSYQLKQDELAWLEAWNYLVENLEKNTLPGFPIWIDALTVNPKLTDDMPSWKVGILTKNSNFYNENKDFIQKWLSMSWGVSNLKIKEFPPSRQKFEWQARKKFPTKEKRTLKDLVIQFRPSGLRVKPATYLPALVAITQTSIIGSNVRKGINNYRKITPYEASKLQKIDGNIFNKAKVKDSVAYKQLGNSVSTGLVEYVAKQTMGIF